MTHDALSSTPMLSVLRIERVPVRATLATDDGTPIDPKLIGAWTAVNNLLCLAIGGLEGANQALMGKLTPQVEKYAVVAINTLIDINHKIADVITGLGQGKNPDIPLPPEVLPPYDPNRTDGQTWMLSVINTLQSLIRLVIQAFPASPPSPVVATLLDSLKIAVGALQDLEDGIVNPTTA